MTTMLKLQDIATELGCSVRTVRRLVLPYIPILRVGRLIRVQPRYIAPWRKAGIRTMSSMHQFSPLDPPKRGGVYFLWAPTEGMVKVGWAKSDIRNRVAELRCGSPVRLVLVGLELDAPLSRERELHAKFAEHRAAGSEWFSVCDELTDHIAGLR